MKKSKDTKKKAPFNKKSSFIQEYAYVEPSMQELPKDKKEIKNNERGSVIYDIFGDD